ncbi:MULTISPECIES: hypothetical protein [Clostridia]|jgi:hypothetical protein|uniref:hypothetical protein n=1 Tax=Clostridia TaxID=186801 RepID=UPI0015FA162F|nr:MULTISPECIES: hypothetical protein [Clostridia]
MKKKKKESGTDLGIVIGFFAALLLKNPLWILIGIVAGSIYDMFKKKDLIP